jgi:hypothetical protein
MTQPSGKSVIHVDDILYGLIDTGASDSILSAEAIASIHRMAEETLGLKISKIKIDEKNAKIKVSYKKSKN